MAVGLILDYRGGTLAQYDRISEMMPGGGTSVLEPEDLGRPLARRLSAKSGREISVVILERI
jgi:hypothetical protein